MASRKQGGYHVPGFGLPLKWQQCYGEQQWVEHTHNTFLESALDGSEGAGKGFDPLTVPERMMLSLMNEITDLSDWNSKVYEADFVEDWKKEMLERENVTQQMVDWCIQEVRHNAKWSHDGNPPPALDRGVYKSDTHIPLGTKERLSAAASRLDQDPDVRRHIATGSDRQRSSTVDPYLYPLIFGATSVLRDGMISRADIIEHYGEGRLARLGRNKDSELRGRRCYVNENAWSTRYQWLPCDISLDNHVQFVKIKSYINNVHPRNHEDFYIAAEGFIYHAFPLLNMSLSSLKAPHRLWEPRITPVESAGFLNWEPGPYRSPLERRNDHIWPNIPGTRESLFTDLQKEFWDVGLQGVFELSSIILTPSNPNYEGEEWHVVGQMNERICATVMYFYSCHNMSYASISFRQKVTNEIPMDQNTFAETTAETEKLYGIKDQEPMLQHMGDVLIREDRAISFPNTFQTRINSFNLADNSCPGHCKFLTFHLVDPNRRMMSTALVPPQRRDWWAAELRRTVPVFYRLPLEVFNNIIDSVEGYPLSIIDAEKVRKSFLAERATFTRKHTAAMMKPKFNLMTEARRHEEAMGYH